MNLYTLYFTDFIEHGIYSCTWQVMNRQCVYWSGIWNEKFSGNWAFLGDNNCML